MYIRFNPFSTRLETPYLDFYFSSRVPGWFRTVHRDSYFQFMMVIDGQLFIETDTRKVTLTQGMILIIPPDILHSLKSEEGYHYFGIDFAQDSKDSLIRILTRQIKETVVVDAPKLLELLPEIEDCNRLQTAVSIQKIRNRLEYMTLYCIEKLNKQNSEQAFCEKLIQYFREHISENLTLDDISKILFISSSHIEYLSHREFGCGVMHLFNRLKVDRACMLLQTSDLRVSGIASHLGYNDQNYFSRIFRKYSGVSPSKYRKLQ